MPQRENNKVPEDECQAGPLSLQTLCICINLSMMIKAEMEAGNVGKKCPGVPVCLVFNERIVHSWNLAAFRELSLPFVMICLLTAVCAHGSLVKCPFSPTSLFCPPLCACNISVNYSCKNTTQGSFFSAFMSRDLKPGRSNIFTKPTMCSLTNPKSSRVWSGNSLSSETRYVRFFKVR